MNFIFWQLFFDVKGRCLLTFKQNIHFQGSCDFWKWKICWFFGIELIKILYSQSIAMCPFSKITPPYCIPVASERCFVLLFLNSFPLFFFLNPPSASQSSAMIMRTRTITYKWLEYFNWWYCVKDTRFSKLYPDLFDRMMIRLFKPTNQRL